MKHLCAGAVLIGSLLTGNAIADESGPYLSAGLGRIDAPDTAELGGLTGDTENDEWSWSVGVGYRLNRNIALELGYIDLGELEADLTDATGATESSAHASFGAGGATLALVGVFPVGRWEPYVRAGVLFAHTDLRFKGSLAAEPFEGRLTNDSEDALYGAGVRYAITVPLRIYLDLTYFDEVGDSETGRSDYLNASAGVVWQF